VVAISIDPFWTLALALLLDAAIGRPAWLKAPIAGVRGRVLAVVDKAEARLNRAGRPARDRRMRGAVALAALAAAAFGVGYVLDGLFAGLPLAKAVLVAAFFAQRSAFDAGRAVAAASSHGGDPHAAGRQAAAGLMARLNADVVGPALAYAVLGLAGLAAYGVITEMAGRLDARDPARQDFGAAANEAARLLLLGAGVATATLVVLAAAFTPSGRPGRAFRAFWQGGGRLRDGRPALPLATLAGALGLSFEGQAGWIGDGRAHQDSHDLRRVLYLFAVACLLHLAGWTALGLLAAG